MRTYNFLNIFIYIKYPYRIITGFLRMSKTMHLEYIKTEIAPAIERLQAEYDAKYVIVEAESDEEMSLALRKSLKEKMYDAIVKPITSLFKKKSKSFVDFPSVIGKSPSPRTSRVPRCPALSALRRYLTLFTTLFESCRC